MQSQKWETCEGIDPYSFGYNRRTKDNEYRSAEGEFSRGQKGVQRADAEGGATSEIIHNLVDITAKNGNYLLVSGPSSVS